MTGNPHFPSPVPTLAQVQADVDALRDAQLAAEARVRGAARRGRVPGSIEVIAASAARRASYEWGSSTDGGKTWVSLPVTLQAKTIVTGLSSRGRVARCF